ITWTSFVTSSTEDTSVKNSLTDSSLLRFNHTGKIADIHISLNKVSLKRSLSCTILLNFGLGIIKNLQKRKLINKKLKFYEDLLFVEGYNSEMVLN
ncbi:MAG: hypothetical protein P8O16_16070, partial [Algoriphagus sp.]|uniref:hypothetical protein n=1 Tax=Algoriphagus sp. TaxID=1872435 RepID=UPI0026261C58